VRPPFLLDTNIVSEFERPSPAENVLAWVRNSREDDLFLSVLSLGEVRQGILKLADGAKQRSLEQSFLRMTACFGARVLTVDENIALRWSEMSAALDKAGKPVPLIDGLLAATALHHDLTLVTRNTRDFESTGVRLLNPWK